ncbi:uncharacterized protein [Musca autumnalis]|uniref:uncharacterized protein n=1 Tax=Musca autumnalis TaxID=221902 RepID=UPI003CE80CD1
MFRIQKRLIQLIFRQQRDRNTQRNIHKFTIMKYIILIAICVISFVTVAQAGDDKCTINGKTLQKGEKYQPPGKCEQYECFGKNGVIHTSCPKIDSLKPCKYVPQDPSKPYPKCCASQKC